MKFLVCLALVALCRSAPTGNVWTPQVYLKNLKIEDKISTHLFGNPDDCTKFYMAIWMVNHWRPFEQTCPPGTHFSSEVSLCVIGSCHKPSGKCTKDGDLLPDEKNCANFYHCSHGTAHLKCCPENLAWNATSKTCGLVKCGQKASCDEYRTPEPVSTTVGPEPASCIVGNYIYTKVEGKPGKYNMEDKDTGVVSSGLSCPFNFVFNTRKLHCGCVNPDIQDAAKGDSCDRFTFNTQFSTAKLYVSENGNGVAIKEGKVCFSTADSFLNVPFYNNLPLNDQVQVTFPCESTDGAGVFLANTILLKDASFAVYLSEGKLIAKIVTDKTTYTVEQKAVVGKVVVRYDGTTLKLIVAGVEKSVTATGKIMKKQSDLFIGKGFVGCIDEIDFCRALSVTDVKN